MQLDGVKPCLRRHVQNFVIAAVDEDAYGTYPCWQGVDNAASRNDVHLPRAIGKDKPDGIGTSLNGRTGVFNIGNAADFYADTPHEHRTPEI